MTTTVIEVHRERGLNGVIDITGDPATQPLGGDSDVTMNGVMQQQQILQQEPPLYDVDLDTMMNGLYKGRYLTPQEFLDDVGKMVHNANVRAYEDVDRLHKAQAMFTAAQVSIQEFDPQLRQECERMAVRERQRREERRREKDKERGDKETNGNAAPAGARRSARNNGLEPEHSITDPVKLERRLKRQRGEESSGADSHGSEGETNGFVGVNANVNGERDAKRTRILDDHEDDRDPLDTLGSSRPGSELRPPVRFALDQNEPIEPMRPLIEVPEANGYPQYHSHQQLPMPPHPSLYPNYSNMPYPHQIAQQMVVDESPRRSGGFDPSLLNPAPMPQNMFGVPSPFAQRPNEMFNFPIDPADPFGSRPNHNHHNQQESFMNMLQGTPTPPPAQLMLSHTPVQQMQIPQQTALERLSTPTPVASSSTHMLTPEPEPVAMVVERSPTPPLPEFKVSPLLLSELRGLLKESTAGLTVEQLEQLRATSLGSVWRHRKDWDRDELTKELIKDVKEFIEEVGEQSGDDD